MWSFDAEFGVDREQLVLLLPQPPEHLDLQQQPEPVSPVRPQDRGVVLLPELGPFLVHAHDRVPGELTGLAVPRDDAVQQDAPVPPLACS